MAVVQSLFGNTPQELMAQRDAALQQQAIQYAQLDPMAQAQAGFYTAGNRLGSGLGGMLGAKDPELERLTAIQKASQQADLTTPEGLITFAQTIKAYDPNAAMQAVQKAQELRKTTAEADVKVLSLQQERQLRDELAKLPSDATQEQLLGVLSKYGPPEKVLAAIQTSVDKAANREAQQAAQRTQIEAAAAAQRERLEARRGDLELQLGVQERNKQSELEMRLQIAQLQGATQTQIAQMRINGQRELEEFRRQGREQLEAFKAQIKALAPAKVDDKAAERIANSEVFRKTSEEGDKLLTTIDKNPQAFTLLGRGATLVKSVTNPNDPAVKVKSDVDAYLKGARNAYLLAAKGVQTEGDAARAWEEFATNLDFSSSDGAKRSVQRIREKLDTQAAANDAYLRARGITPPAAGGRTGAPGTKENPIKLD